MLCYAVFLEELMGLTVRHRGKQIPLILILTPNSFSLVIVTHQSVYAVISLVAGWLWPRCKHNTH